MNPDSEYYRWTKTRIYLPGLGNSHPEARRIKREMVRQSRFGGLGNDLVKLSDRDWEDLRHVALMVVRSDFIEHQIATGEVEAIANSSQIAASLREKAKAALEVLCERHNKGDNRLKGLIR